MPPASIERLVQQGRLGDAVALIDTQPNPDLGEQVLRAFLQGFIANSEDAARAAQSLLSRHLTCLQRALCLETIARTASPADAVRMLRRARELVATSGDLTEIARFEVRYGRAILNAAGVEAAFIELPRLRRAVLNAGDLQATIDLHLLTAEMEARRNKSVRSGVHLRVAEELLQSSGNILQRARLEQVRSGLAFFVSDFRCALSAAEQCAKHAEAAGWLAALGGALGNIGLFRLWLGDLDDAQSFLTRSTQYLYSSKLLELAAKDTQLQVLIAKRDESAWRFAEELWRNEFTGDWRFSCYGLWHQLTRARLFLSRGQLFAASELLEGALPHARDHTDGLVFGRMTLLTAEVEASLGRTKDAARRLGQLYQTMDELPIEIIAEVQKVAGQIAARTNRRQALRCFQRASRILQTSGLLTSWRDLRKKVESCLGSADAATLDHVASEADGDRWPDAESHGEAVQTLAAMMQLAGFPQHFGNALFNLICDMHVAKTAALIEVTANGERTTIRRFGPELATPMIDDDPMKIRIGGGEDSSFVVSVHAKDAASYATLVSLRYLVEMAWFAYEARVKAREAAPLWPEETVEEQLGMVFGAGSMSELLSTTRKLAPSGITVLLTGETGTGKELLARALHETSPRKNRPFIPFNCSAVSRDMLDAQLFGYRRGAFTGAQEAFQGVIRAAAGGTLLLDEIGEISLEVQPKLLRFLESGEIHPLGEPKPVTVEVRVVAATNANLDQLVAQGKFREDLFYRLNVVRLEVPPLRERREEIPLLVQHFLDKCARESQKTGIRIANETMEYLVLYLWPGNVRQLANEVRRLVALAEAGSVLMPEHLSPDIVASRRTLPAHARDLAPTEFVVRTDQPLSAALEHVERSMIQYALKLTGGVEDAAQILGLSRKGLYLKRQRLGLCELSTSGDTAAVGPAAHPLHEPSIEGANAVGAESYRKAPVSRL